MRGQLPPLLTLQNGIGNEEALARGVRRGADDCRRDRHAGVRARGRARCRCTGRGTGRGWRRSGRAAAAPGRAVRSDAGFTVDTFADYRRLKWSKLLMNLLANAQCAILDWTPAQVMADPTAARLEARAWQEAFAVMAASVDPAGRDGRLSAPPVGARRPAAAGRLAGARAAPIRIRRARQQDAVAARRVG